MMNKKILIASLFATLILLVPMTSVVGVSDVEEDCECQDVNRYDLFRVKLLLVRIKVITNILLLRFGHIPEVADKCFDILENLDLNKLQGSPIICAILEPILNMLENLIEYFNYLADLYEGSILRDLFGLMIELLITPVIIVSFLWAAFDCGFQ